MFQQSRKKSIFITLVTLLMISLLSIPALAGQSNVSVTVDNQLIEFPDQQPFLDTEIGRTYVPLRFVSQALGGTVNWDSPTQTAIIKKENVTINMKIGSSNPTVSGEEKTLDAPARLMNGRTMVPLRFISECLGANVQWDGQNKMVSITDKGEPNDDLIDDTILEEVESLNVVASVEMKNIMPGVYVAIIKLDEGNSTDNFTASIGDKEMEPRDDKSGFYLQVSDAEVQAKLTNLTTNQWQTVTIK